MGWKGRGKARSKSRAHASAESMASPDFADLPTIEQLIRPPRLAASQLWTDRKCLLRKRPYDSHAVRDPVTVSTCIIGGIGAGATCRSPKVVPGVDLGSRLVNQAGTPGNPP